MERIEKYTRRYKGTVDIFFGIEHRLRKEEIEEQFNEDTKEGWRFAADGARISDEKGKQGGSQAHVERSLCRSR